MTFDDYLYFLNLFINYQVFNMLGEVLLSGEVNSTDKIEIYANNFEKGCYIVKISWDEKCQVGKFIKYWFIKVLWNFNIIFFDDSNYCTKLVFNWKFQPWYFKPV